jgi:glycosyltransferase involved in cell wall biosynthesis
VKDRYDAMYILLVVRYDPFNSPSGTEIFVGNLSLELAKQGHRVGLVYESRASFEVANESVDGVETYGFHLISLPYVRALHYQRECAKVCTNLTNKSRIDAVISFGAGTFAGYIFKKIKRSSKEPLLVYYAIDSMVAEYKRSMLSLSKRGVTQRLKAWIWYNELIRSDKLSCNVADLIIASCKDTANSLVRDYKIIPKKVELVYFGLPDNYAEGFQIHDTETPTFLHVSTVPERKGTLYFLEALKTLEDKYNLRARGIIAGSKETFYVEMAKKLDVDVDFLGRIPNNKLKQYYASSTALVSPSLSEGFCLPIIEAAMFGKPSVVTNIGSLPELVTNGKTGCVIPVADTNALADCLYQIAIDGGLRRKMGENARRRSADFTLSQTVSNLLNLIEKRRIEAF